MSRPLATVATLALAATASACGQAPTPAPAPTPTTTSPPAPEPTSPTTAPAITAPRSAAPPPSTVPPVEAAGVAGEGMPGQHVTLEAIKRCESGGNYEAENPTSSASGAYQVLDTTWDGYGGYERASDAPPEVQEAWAREALAEAGTTPWRASRSCWRGAA